VIREFLIPSCALAVTTVGLAGAAEPNEGVAKTFSLDFKAMPLVTPEAPQQVIPEDDVELATLVAPFGEQGSWRWNVQDGFNFSLLLRWHVLARDVGAGVMETSDAVPASGPSFNFTAQGGGISFEISDEVRLVTGVRWHHISNGRTFDNNPGLYNLYVYTGLSFPF